MPSFEIPDGPANVKLQSGPPEAKAPRTGSIVFNVTNKAGVPLAGRLSLQTGGQTEAEWFAIDGEKERTFAAGETETVAIRIAVPPEAEPGDYSFRLRVVAVNDPDNDHTAGPASVARVEGAAVPKSSALVWPFILAAVVVLLAVGGVAAWQFWPGGGNATDESNAAISYEVPSIPVPMLVGLNLKDAEPLAKDLSLSKKKVDPTGAEPGTILDQSPAKGTLAVKNQVVNVYYDPGVAVPDLGTGTFDDALSKLDAAGFKNEFATICGKGLANHVGSQDPGPGTSAAKGSIVRVFVNVQTPATTPSMAQRFCARMKIPADTLKKAIARGNLSATLNMEFAHP
jgi:hypothetical protein